jgi:hypothetical protein
MSDLRSQINSLSAAEKADLLDTLWKSLEVENQPTLSEFRDRLHTREAVNLPLDTARLVRKSASLTEPKAPHST